MSVNRALYKGDTFDVSGFVAIRQNGIVVENMTGWDAVVQIRTSTGTLVAELHFEWLDILTGKARIWADDTSAWATGLLTIALKFTNGTTTITAPGTTQLEVREALVQ